jgi:hypothetical protein
MIEHIHAYLLSEVRIRNDRDRELIACVLDSQTVKRAAGVGESGFNDGKNITVESAISRLMPKEIRLMFVVSPANIIDAEGGTYSLGNTVSEHPNIIKAWSAHAYAGIIDDMRELYGIELEIVPHIADQHTFIPLSRR